MAIQTGGFNFNPSFSAASAQSASGAGASRQPLQFIDGKSLAPSGDQGIALWAQGETNRQKSVQDGLAAVGAAALGIYKLSQDKQASAQEQERYDEKIALERERMAQDLLIRSDSDYNKERTRGLRLANDRLEKGGSTWDPTTSPGQASAQGEVLQPVDLYEDGVETPLQNVTPTFKSINAVQPLSDVAGASSFANLGPASVVPVSAGAKIPLSSVAAPSPESPVVTEEGAWKKTPTGYERARGGYLETWQDNGKGRPTMVARSKIPTPEKPGILTSEQKRGLNTLQDNISQNPQIKMAYDAVGSYGIVTSNLSAQTGTGDITAINAFQRMVDPGVAVREGDVTLIQQAIPKLERWGLKAKNLVVGDQLSPEVRKQMLEAAENMVRARVDYSKDFVERYRKQAKLYDLSPDDLLPPLELPKNMAVRISTKAEYDALDSGTPFQWPGKSPGIKP